MPPVAGAACLILTQWSALALVLPSADDPALTPFPQQYPDMALPAASLTDSVPVVLPPQSPDDPAALPAASPTDPAVLPQNRDDWSPEPKTPPPGCGSNLSGALEPHKNYGNDWAWWVNPHHAGTVGFLESAALSSDNPVVYDLGCGNGIQEIRVMKNLMRSLNNFTMVFVDTAFNNWEMARASLASTMHAVYPAEGRAYKDSALLHAGLGGRRVHGMVGALLEGDIYTQVAPDESVDLIYTSHAVSYLSNPLGYQRPTAAMDWMIFLQHRAAELKPGGWLFVTGMAALKGTYKEGRVWALLNEVLNDAVKAHLLTADERLAWRFAAFPRSREMWYAPFKMGHVKQLKMEKFEIEELNDPFWVISDNDACAFAKSYVDRTMTWLGNYLGQTTNENVKAYFKARLTEDVQSYPELYHRTTVVANLAIKKLSVEEMAAMEEEGGEMQDAFPQNPEGGEMQDEVPQEPVPQGAGY